MAREFTETEAGEYNAADRTSCIEIPISPSRDLGEFARFGPPQGALQFERCGEKPLLRSNGARGHCPETDR